MQYNELICRTTESPRLDIGSRTAQISGKSAIVRWESSSATYLVHLSNKHRIRLTLEEHLKPYKARPNAFFLLSWHCKIISCVNHSSFLKNPSFYEAHLFLVLLGCLSLFSLRFPPSCCRSQCDTCYLRHFRRHFSRLLSH